MQELYDLLEDGLTVLPIKDTDYFVLWRKSLIEKEWTQGYGITMVDFSSELFGLSTLFVEIGFF
jgi:hypothetical protein